MSKTRTVWCIVPNIVSAQNNTLLLSIFHLKQYELDIYIYTRLMDAEGGGRAMRRENDFILLLPLDVVDFIINGIPAYVINSVKKCVKYIYVSY